MNTLKNANERNVLVAVDIQNDFNASAGELAAHMKKEELILFPFMRKMPKAKKPLSAFLTEPHKLQAFN